jgi:hypothetical protein
MLFYQFVVTRTGSDRISNAAPAEAKVMIRVDGDIAQRTDEAVQRLEQRGWHVETVRHAQLADSIDEFASTDELVPLYRDALREGMAIAITALRGLLPQRLS